MKITKINLYECKEVLKEEIEKLDLNNLQKQLNNIRRNINNIETMHQLDLLRYEVLEQEFLATEHEEEPKEEEIEENQLKENEYVFKKKLFGGIIEGTNVFVAENAIREMNLETGDVVTFSGNVEFKNMRFVRKISKKQTDDFFIYKYCEVKYDDPILYCDESSFEGGCTIRIDEIPYKFVIPSNMIDKFKIKEGDFIDIGYEKSDPYEYKFIWKYDQDEYIKPKTSGHYKSKNEQILNEMFYGIDFNKAKILVIGCEPRKKYYKEAIEKCNGEFMFSSGNEQAERMIAQIDNADIVLILKDFLSHTAVKIAVAHSKEKNKHFKVVDGLGIKTIIFEVRKLLLNEKYDLENEEPLKYY